MVTSSPLLLSFFFAPAACLLHKQRAGTQLVTDVAGDGVNLKEAAPPTEVTKRKALGDKHFESRVSELEAQRDAKDTSSEHKAILDHNINEYKKQDVKNTASKKSEAAFAAKRNPVVTAAIAAGVQAQNKIESSRKAVAATQAADGPKAAAVLRKFHTTEEAKRLKDLKAHQNNLGSKAAPKQGILPLEWETGKCFTAAQQKATKRHYLDVTTKVNCANLCAGKISSMGTYRTYCQFDSDLDAHKKDGQCSYFTPGLGDDEKLHAGSKHKDIDIKTLSRAESPEERESRRGFCAPVGFSN